MADTIAGNTSTTTTLASTHSQIYGTIDFAGDADWYKVALDYGYAYQVWVEGAYFGNGTLVDPYLGFFDSAGWYVDENDDYTNHFSGSIRDSYRYFVPNSSGAYFLSAEEWGDDATGTYLLTIIRDELESTATAAAVTVNDRVFGNLGQGYDPSDWYRVYLVANTNYQFDLLGLDGDGAWQGLSLPDPLMMLRNEWGSVITSDDDSGLFSNARISFTPSQSGVYFIDASESAYEYVTYSYELIVNATPVRAALALGSPTTGIVDFLGDTDLYSFAVEAGRSYTFHLQGDVLADPFLELLDASRSVLDSDEGEDGSSDSFITYRALTAGTIYLAARASGNAGTGSYVLDATITTGSDAFTLAGNGDREVGVLRVMADFSKAAYAVQSWENKASNTVKDYSDAALQGLVADGWTPVTLAIAGMSSTSGVFTNRMSAGFYSNGNAAAFVARNGDALVISFRGTNDTFYDVGDWTNKSEHYDLLRPLVAALEKYIDNAANGIHKIFVTGHSLGGAMAIKFMDDHGSASYEAVTFAAPGYDAIGSYDERMTLLEVNRDIVPNLGFNNGPTIHFETGLLSAEHSMDLYRQITDSIDADSWSQILSLRSMAPEVLIATTASGNAYIVDGLVSGTNAVVNNGNSELTDPLGNDFDVLYGGRGADELNGGTDDELLLGGPGSDSIYGSWGDDWLDAGSGNDTLDGGHGTDTAVLGVPLNGLSGYYLSGDALVLQTSNGDKSLVDIERVKFDDVSFALDTQEDDSVWQAEALLWAQFGVAPSVGLLSYWVHEADNSSNMKSLAQEMLDLYAPGQSAADLVIHLFATLAGITPTAQQVSAIASSIGFGKTYQTTGDFFAQVASDAINTDRMIGFVGSIQQLDSTYFGFGT